MHKTYICLITLVAALGGFLFGYDLAIISGASLHLKQAFKLTPAQFGFAISSAILGCVFGSALSGWIADLLGRRRTLIVTALLFGASAVGTALPETIETFYIFRIIGGIGVGLASVVSPMYISEISPASMRGRMVTLNQFALVVGAAASIYVAFFLAHCLPDAVAWRWMFASECVPILFFVVFLCCIPRSPRWLVKKQRPAEAHAVLLRIHESQSAEKELADIRESLQLKTGSFSELFAPGIKMALAVGVGLAFLQQWTSVSPLGMYAPTIFQKAGFEKNTDAIFQASIMHVFNLACVILALWIVGRFGRKPLLMIGYLGMGLGLSLLALVFTLDIEGVCVLLTMLLCMLAFQVTAAPLTWVVMSEIFPTRLRAKGMCLASLVLWSSAFVIFYLFPLGIEFFEKRYGSTAGLFWSFVVVCLLACAFCYKMVPETKDRSLEEIGRFWSSNQ